MSFSKADVTSTLTSKLGFQEQPGTKHEKYRLEVDGQFVAQTVMSRSWDDISKPMVSNLARQIGLNTGQFRRVMDCRMGRQAYLDAVTSSGQ